MSPARRPRQAQDSPATAALIDVAISLQDLAAKQEALRELFESRLRSDEVQAKALERLHDQVREYKTNFVRQEMQPLLRDLIYLLRFAADEVERANRGGPLPTPRRRPGPSTTCGRWWPTSWRSTTSSPTAVARARVRPPRAAVCPNGADDRRGRREEGRRRRS